ncbi:hypothetical protein Tco_1523556 [Tanacetum coccineum]
MLHNLHLGFKSITTLKSYDIEHGEWKWHADWHHKFPMITSLTVPDINADIEDKIVWRTKNGLITGFSVSIANYDLNSQSPIVPWWKLLWFPQCIPKHTFILCLKHLFFQCLFCADVWNRAQLMAEIRGKLNDWQSILHGMIDAGNGKNIKSIIRRLLLAAFIKNKLIGTTVKDSKDVKDVENKWKISNKSAIHCFALHLAKELGKDKKDKREQNRSKPTRNGKGKTRVKNEAKSIKSRISLIQEIKTQNESQRINVDKFTKLKGSFG